jgi:hypothetical protein
MKSYSFSLLVAAFLALCSSTTLHASFHLMQIQEIIGGVNGDTSAQAIELRMRSAGQNLLLTGVPNSPAQLVAFDANGLNPVTLITFNANVTNGLLGDTVLVTTANFTNDVSPGFSGALQSSTNRDFTLTNSIPASYLAAGRLAYEESTGTILWSVAWGGTGYTGATGGTSGLNGVTDPGKFANALPTSGLNGLLYTGAANGTNANNATDYAITTGAATLTNNSRASFAVVPEPNTSVFVMFTSAVWLVFCNRRMQCK